MFLFPISWAFKLACVAYALLILHSDDSVTYHRSSFFLNVLNDLHGLCNMNS